ncbi:hypothetical protein J2T08_004825 [Neorhizobium galegae]|nr:hypothetical protein [Neorhizobium galegae]
MLTTTSISARLLFDIPQRAERDITFRMGHGHPAGLLRMLELNMAALLGDLDPAIFAQQRTG